MCFQTKQLALVYSSVGFELVMERLHLPGWIPELAMCRCVTEKKL